MCRYFASLAELKLQDMYVGQSGLPWSNLESGGGFANSNIFDYICNRHFMDHFLEGLRNYKFHVCHWQCSRCLCIILLPSPNAFILAQELKVMSDLRRVWGDLLDDSSSYKMAADLNRMQDDGDPVVQGVKKKERTRRPSNSCKLPIQGKPRHDRNGPGASSVAIPSNQ